MKLCMSLIKNLVGLVVVLQMPSCNLAPGSYPHAEEYEINSNEALLIKAIQGFKKDNPQFNVPEQTQLRDGRNNDKDHWYHLYFYYPQENQIVYAWTRPIDGKRTTFAFVSVNQGLTLGNWKEINNDFDRSENNEQKRKFEERILSKIKARIE